MGDKKASRSLLCRLSRSTAIPCASPPHSPPPKPMSPGPPCPHFIWGETEALERACRPRTAVPESNRFPASLGGERAPANKGSWVAGCAGGHSPPGGQRAPADAARTAFGRVRPLPAPAPPPGGRTQPTPRAPRFILEPSSASPAFTPLLQTDWIPFHLSGPGSNIFAVFSLCRFSFLIDCTQGPMRRSPVSLHHQLHPPP